MKNILLLVISLQYAAVFSMEKQQDRKIDSHSLIHCLPNEIFNKIVFDNPISKDLVSPVSKIYKPDGKDIIDVFNEDTNDLMNLRLVSKEIRKKIDDQAKIPYDSLFDFSKDNLGCTSFNHPLKLFIICCWPPEKRKKLLADISVPSLDCLKWNLKIFKKNIPSCTIINLDTVINEVREKHKDGSALGQALGCYQM